VRMVDALLIQTLIMIVASVCAVGLVARMRLPAAVGYLVAGLVIGPHGLRLLAAGDEVRFLAELGIIFLMFMVGLEFSLPALIAGRRDASRLDRLVGGGRRHGVGTEFAYRAVARRSRGDVIDRHHA
jgi:Kef-type K+ transport system membrane component KefB